MSPTPSAETIGFSDEGLARAHALLQDAVDRDQLLGAALQVSRRGRPLPTACFGRRQVDPAGAPVTEDTVFLIASITKPIVCAAVVQLIEEGRLRLDDTAASVLPRHMSGCCPAG